MTTLHFRSLTVGKVDDLYFCDETWYGLLEPDHSIGNCETGKQILDYIEFSKDWHRRLQDDESNPPGTVEWDQYAPLLDAQWIIEDGEVRHQVNGPVVLRRGSSSCRPWGHR